MSNAGYRVGNPGDQFQCSSGSIIGREHVRLHRNNQDSLSVCCRGDLLVAAVADGCSSGRFSEVGARLGVGWLVSQLTGRLAGRILEPAEALIAAVSDGLVSYLGMVGGGLEVQDSDWPALVRDHLLFTFQVAIVSPRRTLVFGLGDGVVSINGRLTVLDAGPSNAPCYLAYRLVRTGVAPLIGSLQPVVHFDGPTESVHSLLIGTDGLLDLRARAGEPLKDGTLAGDIDAFEKDSRYQCNSSLLQKRLVVLGEVNQRLRDDTSLVLIRRRELEN